MPIAFSDFWVLWNAAKPVVWWFHLSKRIKQFKKKKKKKKKKEKHKTDIQFIVWPIGYLSQLRQRWFLFTFFLPSTIFPYCWLAKVFRQLYTFAKQTLNKAANQFCYLSTSTDNYKAQKPEKPNTEYLQLMNSNFSVYPVFFTQKKTM